MQNLGCQLTFSVRAVLAGKNARQQMLSRATRQNKTMLPFVFDDDDNGDTWSGDPDLSPSIRSTVGCFRSFAKKENTKKTKTFFLR